MDEYTFCRASAECCEGFSCDILSTNRCYPSKKFELNGAQGPREIYQPCSILNMCARGLSCHTNNGLNRCYHNPRLGGEPCHKSEVGSQCMEGLVCDEKSAVCVQTEKLSTK